jgi:hypothetical protein
MKAPVKIFSDAKEESDLAGCELDVSKIRRERESAERDRCVDCGLEAPVTETAYTLISPRHRWRLRKVVDAAGHQVVEWRCAPCWAKLRAKAGSTK